MKKVFCFVALMGVLVCCTNPIDTTSNKGHIYGIVTELSSAEPMRGAGISLCVQDGFTGDLYMTPKLLKLLETVTYDDGHFEFNDIEPGKYYVTIETEEYENVRSPINVEAGRTARVDIQLKLRENGITVKTDYPTINANTASFTGHWTSYYVGCEAHETGFAYGSSKKPSKGKDNFVVALKDFTAEVKNMKNGTYHVRAYAVNRNGITYGEDVIFEIK